MVSDQELEEELIRLTDWHTDELFEWLAEDGATLVIDRLSRLVFDPERFADASREPTEAMGQGLVYTHGSHRQRLREDSDQRRAERIRALYRPYHDAIDALVGELLTEFGTCLVIDCHSFPTVAMPSELDQRQHRPAICIGTDPVHTPPDLATALERAFQAEGLTVGRDVPFKGTLVPGAFYRREPQVHSVMIEVRRDLYMDERRASKSDRFEHIAAVLQRAMRSTGMLGARS